MRILLQNFKLKAALLLVLLLAGGSQEALAQCKANFFFSKQGRTVSFYDSSSAQNGFKRQWTFGDGGKSDGKNPVHTYTKDSTFQVCLKIIDSVANCTNTYCVKVEVKACRANFRYTIGGNGREVTFYDSSIAEHGYKVSWDFGDMSTSDSRKPVTHLYKFDGYNNVCLKITDTVNGCTSQYCQNVYVKAKNTGCAANFRYTINGKEVSFYDSSTATNGYKVYWSFGDGSHSDNKTPKHTYAKDTIYTVCLKINDTVNKCETTTCKTFNLRQRFCISGRIKAGSNLAAPGKVWLIKFNATDSSLKAVRTDTIRVDSNNVAYYQFCDIENGTYYVKAALKKSAPDYSSYLPTYWEKDLYWATANAIVVNGANVTGKNIQLIQGTNPGGKGFIKGKISQGANKTGDPQADVQVLLLDANRQPVAYTYSDAMGLYSFENLAFGEYYVHPEILALNNVPATVRLKEDSVGVESLDFKVNSYYISYSLGVRKTPVQADARVFPNPSAGNFTITLNSRQAEQALVRVLALDGRVVYTRTERLTAGSNSLQVDLTDLPAGAYMLTTLLPTQNVQMQCRLIKE